MSPHFRRLSTTYRETPKGHALNITPLVSLAAKRTLADVCRAPHTGDRAIRHQAHHVAVSVVAPPR